MISPVLDFELLRGSRSNGLLLLRRIYTGWLVLQLLFFYWLYLIQSNLLANSFADVRINTDATAAFVNSCASTFITQQFILLALCTPALTAGAITDEKTRGTLQYLLTADVTGWEIVTSKLFGRIWQVLILCLAVLPMLCFLVGLGGFHPIALAVPFVLVLVPVFSIASASLLASVWCRQTRDAVLTVYIGLLAASGLAAWFGVTSYFNPLHVMESAWDEEVNLEELSKRAGICTAVWLCLGLVFLGLAGWRLRGAYLRQLQNEGVTKKARWWKARRRPVSDDPLRWKESQVEGVAPLMILRRFPRWLGVTITAGATVVSSLAILGTHAEPVLSIPETVTLLFRHDPAAWSQCLQPAGEGFRKQAVLALFLATLLMGLRCSGAVTGERERQTWEALLLTPLAVKQLLRGKLWGIIGASYPYLAAYAIPAMLLSLWGGFAAFFWTALLLGVSWLGMAYAGSAGLFCSARSSSSWRSLLATVGLGYAAGFLVYGFAWIVVPIAFLFFMLALWIFDTVLLGGQMHLADMFANSATPFLILSYIALAGFFICLTWLFLRSAQKYIADRERMRIWKKDEDETAHPTKRHFVL
ncbi:MAG TPA: ABC transporter permease subunit [Gemmataceae bacterium]|jgi:ABC-type transport system involved in multi-copper enzyme maturation permease subunit|nr:ABC transporter permease subunit [Gemmataceae bacterium]